MRKQLSLVAFAIAALPGLAPAVDWGLTPPTSDAVAVSVAPTAVSPARRESSPPVAPDTQRGPDPGPGWAAADWACAQPSCFWVRGEYLMWWIKDSQVPALVTTGVPGATLLPGALGQPGTRVLFGGSDIENQMRSGGRFTAGFWLNDSQTLGVEGSYFFLGSRSGHFDRVSGGTAGSAVIARPFFDVLTGLQNSQLVAFPGLARGEVHVSYSSRLQGAELNIFCLNGCEPCADACADPCGPGAPGDARHRARFRVSLLGGFRYLQLDEGLGITEITQVNPVLGVPAAVFAGSPLFGGSTITISDQIGTHNYFYGPQFGGRAEACWGRVFANVQGKVALGVTHEVVDIRGRTAITSPAGATAVTPAGFLASGSNSGHFTRNRFAVVPELGVNVGYQITSNVRASVGYTFLYWSSVVRPGDQVDLGLSGTQIRTDSRFNPAAGPARPAVLVRDTDFWAQGVSFGLEFRY